LKEELPSLTKRFKISTPLLKKTEIKLMHCMLKAKKMRMESG